MALSAALLIAVWYDFSEVKLAEVLDNWAPFRRFCGFEVVPRGTTSRPRGAAGDRLCTR
jgi:hypothetical protein